MAAQISHVVAGEAAFEAASGRTMRSLGTEAARAFDFGCQGPDIFYHNQRTMPSGLHYGSLAHRRRYGSLVAGAAASLAPGDRVPDRVPGAYLLGLATHAAVDRATHPYIVCRSGAPSPERRQRGRHPFLERLLDAELLRERFGSEVRGFGLAERLGRADEGADAAIASLWEAGLRAAYPRAASEDRLLERRIANAIADGRGFYRQTDPAATAGSGRMRALPEETARRLVALVYPELDHRGLDALNGAKAAWPHPAGDGRSSCASYPELLDQAALEAAKVLEAILGSWAGGEEADSLDEGLALLVGEGSLSIVDASGSAAVPRAFKPLPLPEAMEAEYRARRLGEH